MQRWVQFPQQRRTAELVEQGDLLKFYARSLVGTRAAGWTPGRLCDSAVGNLQFPTGGWTCRLSTPLAAGRVWLEEAAEH